MRSAHSRLGAELFLETEFGDDPAERLEADLARFNSQQAAYKRIDATRIRTEEFPKTTTKKIRRRYQSVKV